MNTKKVLFIDSVHPVLAERLEEAGYRCEWKTDLKRQESLAILSEYHGVVIRSKFKFDQEAFEAAPELQWIARSGAGMENIDLVHAKSKGVHCFSSPEGNRDAVAEHALGMLLSLFNRLSIADQEVRRGEWNREANRGIELKGKTIGILGFGYMGQALAQRLKGFDCRIVAYDKYKEGYAPDYVQEVDEASFFAQTEILSIHLPFTEETNGMINQSYLGQFAHSLYVINTARGKNVVTKDLLDALDNGKVLGACLDVLEYEALSFEALNAEELPAPFRRLQASDKVLLSPHVAGWTHESYKKLSLYLAEKILAHFPAR